MGCWGGVGGVAFSFEIFQLKKLIHFRDLL